MSVAANPIATGWLNENSLREYPFHEGCGLRPNDSAGTLVEDGWSIPNCLVVDMTVAVSGSVFDPFLYLGQMSVIDRSVTLAFCDRSGERVISVYATLAGHSKNDSYEVAGTGSYFDARGVVCLGDLELFFEQTPEGVYSFSPEETRVEPTCIRPSSAGVRSIAAEDSSGYSSGRIIGDLRLVAGQNIRFNYVPDDNSLWVSADPNSGYEDSCECEDIGSRFVKTINGISVDNVKIVGDDCVKVAENRDTGVITISDTCAKPCCGCAETTFINQTINDLRTSIGTLEGNVSSLGDRLMSFVDSYVLSRKTLK